MSTEGPFELVDSKTFAEELARKWGAIHETHSDDLRGLLEAQRARGMRVMLALVDAYLAYSPEDILARLKDIMRDLGIELEEAL